jgi:hypothetical protein
MSYRPKRLTHYERGFVLGAGFLSGAAFALTGHKLLTGSFPLYTYVFFLATLTMCLGVFFAISSSLESSVLKRICRHGRSA